MNIHIRNGFQECRKASQSEAMSQLIAEVRAARQLPAPALAREIRRAAGVSRDRLAAELGVHPVTVTRWESGTRHPRGTLRVAYAQLLGQLAAEVGQ